MQMKLSMHLSLTQMQSDVALEPMAPQTSSQINKNFQSTFTPSLIFFVLFFSFHLTFTTLAST